MKILSTLSLTCSTTPESLFSTLHPTRRFGSQFHRKLCNRTGHLWPSTIVGNSMRNEPNPKSYETHVPKNCDLPASPHTQSSGLTLLATRKFLPLHFAQSLDRMAWMKDLGGCCLARWRSRGNTKNILVHACSCECITYADEEVPSHKSLKDVFGIVIVWVFVKERRWLDRRHSVSNITSIHFRPSTVNGKQAGIDY